VRKVSTRGGRGGPLSTFCVVGSALHMKQASPVGINDSEWEQAILENKKKNRNVIDLDALKIKSK
jgi:hypothetical protein